MGKRSVRVTHECSSTFAGCIGRSNRTRCNACVLERIELRRKKYWQATFGPVEIKNDENRGSCEAPEIDFTIDAIAMQDPWVLLVSHHVHISEGRDDYHSPLIYDVLQ